MNEILTRLNYIEELIKVATIDDLPVAEDRLKSKRDGILFALRALGIELVYHFRKGWLCHVEVAEDGE